MSLATGVLVVAVVLLALGVLGYFIVRTATQQRKGVAALAEELGFTFEETSPELLTQFDDFSMFAPDPYRSYQVAWNVLKGTTGRATVWLFDYNVRARGDKWAHNSTICALRSPDLELPYFYLRHRFLTETAAPDPAGTSASPDSGALTAESGEIDIHFPDDADFTSHLVLRGRGGAVRRLFDAELRQHLRPFGEAGRAPARVIEGSRDAYMLVTSADIDATRARALIEHTTSLLPLLSRRSRAR